MRGLGVLLLLALIVAACAGSRSSDEAYCEAYSRFLNDMVSTNIAMSEALAQMPRLEVLARSVETDELRQSAERLALIVGKAERTGRMTDDGIDENTFGAILKETSTLNYLCGFTE